ncbi:ROK family protein [Phytoactinopolyspora limicola]|uniref:ROK family protein n=1 Tax=Phytoactinopolyspora limicola TaxID=2715536 RepID=UPI001407B883|nr:ROK family protein [Phytoactinopolyspora limicola]
MFIEAPAVELDGDAAVIAVDIGGTKIDVALAAATGAVLDRVRFPTFAEQGPAQALDRIAAAVARLSGPVATEHGRSVVAYAAVSPGVVRSDGILFAPNLPGWERLALADSLRAELAVADVVVANDVRAGALAELRFGALRGSDPGVYISLGTGVAAALTIGGQVVAGAHQAAGEIGYLTRSTTDPAVLHNGHAAFEEMVSGKAIGAAAGRFLGVDLDAAAVLASSDVSAQHVVHQALGELATAIANIAVLVDPERVVIGGGMMAHADVILPIVSHHVRQAVPFPPDVLPATFTEDASLHGAVALALDSARTHVSRETI